VRVLSAVPRGTLPDQLSTLTKLQWLLLDNNQLSGSLPRYLGAMPHLKQAQLQNNNFSGEVPGPATPTASDQGWCSNQAVYDVSFNPLLCGESAIGSSCRVRAASCTAAMVLGDYMRVLRCADICPVVGPAAGSCPDPILHRPPPYDPATLACKVLGVFLTRLEPVLQLPELALPVASPAGTVPGCLQPNRVNDIEGTFLSMGATDLAGQCDATPPDCNSEVGCV
jgi:hypothetical protein